LSDEGPGADEAGLGREDGIGLAREAIGGYGGSPLRVPCGEGAAGGTQEQPRVLAPLREGRSFRVARGRVGKETEEKGQIARLDEERIALALGQDGDGLGQESEGVGRL
jgi:hypothetical protein